MKYTAAILSLLMLLILGVAAIGCLRRPVDRAGICPVDTGTRIDLNSADPATLMLLPGIGPSAAAHIVAARDHSGGGGPLRNASDLHRLPAMSDSARAIPGRVIANLAPYVVCGPSATGMHP